jgi:MerR family transcriptional regulator, light-induced transcriptional regulator
MDAEPYREPDETAIADEAYTLFLKLRPELSARCDKASLDRCREDIRYHVRYINRAYLLKSEALLSDYLGWLKVLFARYEVADEEILASFRCIAYAFEKLAGPEANEGIQALIDRALFAYPRVSAEALRWSRECVSASGQAAAYLKAMLDGRREFAEGLVDEMLAGGAEVRDLYLEVFQPSQRELGRLWHKGLINPAQEHFVSAGTQYQMSRLYPALFAAAKRNRNGLRLIAAAAPGEMHEIGLRMVTDMLEMDGWDTRYLGSNVPEASLVSMARGLKADAVALSATTAPNASMLAPMIAALRAEMPDLKIVVGGPPFIVDEELARRMGADGSAEDCAGAVGLMRSLMKG